ncbi:MAG: PD-(D/E)XK nuclease family protein [Nanoarchaeota archaeon]
MVTYSHSRLCAFEQCQFKFKLKYIDKLQPEIEKTVEAYLGEKVHDALEWLYSQILIKITPDIEDLIGYYAKSWSKDFNEEIRIVNNHFTYEYYFDRGIKFLIDYYVKNKPFSDNTIAIEKLVKIDLDGTGKYLLQGYADRLVHNKEANIFEIHDYKTGAIKRQEELDKDRQLALYSLGIKQAFPDEKDIDASNIHLIWHFLDFNEKMKSKRTEEQLEQLKQDIIQLIDKIEAAKDYPANPGALCRWCEFGKYCDKKPS